MVVSRVTLETSNWSQKKYNGDSIAPRGSLKDQGPTTTPSMFGNGILMHLILSDRTNYFSVQRLSTNCTIVSMLAYIGYT